MKYTTSLATVLLTTASYAEASFLRSTGVEVDTSLGRRSRPNHHDDGKDDSNKRTGFMSASLTMHNVIDDRSDWSEEAVTGAFVGAFNTVNEKGDYTITSAFVDEVSARIHAERSTGRAEHQPL